MDFIRSQQVVPFLRSFPHVDISAMLIDTIVLFRLLPVMT
jgi:hypothetical protein